MPCETTWDEGEGGRLSTDGLREQYAQLARMPGTVARKEGNAAKAFAKAARQLSAEYDVPYLAHAPMEPLNCVVDLRDESCEIWTGTQAQTVDQRSAAAITGLKPEQVKIHTMYLGGGFGRRGSKNSDFVSEAAHVAKALRKPVKVIWTREDDIRGGYYRPLWYDRIEAGLDAGGYPVAWRHTIVGQSIMAGSRYEAAMVKGGIDATSVEGAADLPYAIPNILVDLHTPSLPVTTLWWRSVGHSHTAFVVESFIDELAHAPARTPTSSAGPCSAARPATSRCSSWPPRRPAGASPARGPGPRHRRAQVLRQLRGAGGRGVRRGRQGEGPPRRVRRRLRHDGEPRHHRGADGVAASSSASRPPSRARSP